MNQKLTSNKVLEKMEAEVNFIQLLEDPTRMHILFLFLLYKRLNLNEISKLIHRTKPAISHQLNKFIDIGIIKITQQPVRGSITANFYELIPDFLEKVVIETGLSKDVSKNIIKKIEVLQIQAEKETFNLTSNIFLRFAEYYNKLEQKAQEIKESYGIHIPPYSLNILPLSKKAYQFYLQEINNLNAKIIKFIEEEDKFEGNEQNPLERPMLSIVSIIPIKDYLSSIG
ncbi:MAG: ArsR/SmtB family transcription factor [Promethearchaeota archaeon]